MKVVIAAPTYLPSRRANTFQVMKMAQAVQGIGHQVRILVPDGGRGERPDWQEFFDHYGLLQRLDIHWVPVSPRFRGYDYGVKVVHETRLWEGDVLYTRLPQAAALGSSLNVPTIFEVHDLPGGRMAPWLLKVFLKGQGARRLVVISQALLDDLHCQITPLPDPPFTLIAPDGVDLDRYHQIPSPQQAREILQEESLPGLAVDSFTVGYSGHLYEGRGIPLILEMAANLPDVNFLIVGGDPASVDRLRGQVEKRQLANVFLTGFIANRHLPLYQAASEALLMPYQCKVAASSGGDIAPYLSPMKLFEYLACGRVILSSDLPVLREVLDESNAVLLPPEDVNAWIKALMTIRKDLSRQRALMRNARMDAGRYTWKSRAIRIFTPRGGEISL